MISSACRPRIGTLTDRGSAHKIALAAAIGSAATWSKGLGTFALAAGGGVVIDRDDCFALGEVNHQALFRRVAAVAHHGNAGTTTTTAWAGVPQVVVPQIADQPYWAGRVAELGIGAAHDGPTPTVESLSAALGTALEPETRARAAAMAGRIRTDGAMVAARLLIEEVTARRAANEIHASRR